MCPVCSSLLDIAASRQGCHAALFTLRIWFSVFSLTFRQIVKSWSGFHAIPSTVYNSRNASLPECCAAFCLNFFLVCSSLFIIYYRWASLSSLSLPSFPLWTTVNLVHRWQSKNPGHSLTSPSSLAPHTDLGWKQVSGGSDQHLESAGGGGGGGCFWPGVGGGSARRVSFSHSHRCLLFYVFGAEGDLRCGIKHFLCHTGMSFCFDLEWCHVCSVLGMTLGNNLPLSVSCFLYEGLDGIAM